MSELRPKQVWVIGGAPECDIVEANPIVSGRHCMLAEYDEGFALEDLGATNGTFVNGQRLAPHSPVWVTRNDAITLGRTIPMRWPQPPIPQGPTDGRAFVPSHATPVPGRGHTMSVSVPSIGQKVITIGRGDDNTQILDYPMISWNHARIVEDPPGRFLIEDLNSRNGTAIGSPHNRIAPGQPVPISPDVDIYFGSFKIAARRLIGEERVALGNATGAMMPFRGDRMILGRDPNCDVPLDYPMISWHHAELTREQGGIYARDLGSLNGTYVDGIRISGKVQVRPGGEISLGSYRFQLVDASGNLAHRQYNGNVTIEAVQVTIDIKAGGRAQRLVEPVSLTIFPSELVAVMGPAGAGKTTMMKALNGYTAPTFGRVLFNGTELYKFYDQFRLQLGYVPQDDIMHPLLTVNEALYYTAKLRTDLKDAEIKRRVVEVLTKLNIDDIGDRQIGSPEKKVISGGQRKRLNIAMELLSDPNVLFLDEPTTGLSSYDAFKVVKVLRDLADAGKTIVLTIHQPSIDIFKEFDNLVMISRDKGSRNSGALAYYGPAYPDSIQFFSGSEPDRGAPTGNGKGELSPEMLLDGLAQKPTAEWVGRYGQSRTKAEFVDTRAGQLPGLQAQRPIGQSTVRKPGIEQWKTLMGRNGILKLRDRGQMMFMALQATLFPALMCLIYKGVRDYKVGTSSDWAKFIPGVSGVHFLMVIAAVWFGCNNAARDIVGEWAIYMRERMVSLKLPSYVFAKIGTLAIVCFIQCVVLLGIVYTFCDLRSGFVPTLLILFLASVTGCAIGLLISSFASTTEAAIAVIPIPLLFMILLSGGIKPLSEMGEGAAKMSLFFPSRWAFELNMLRESDARYGEIPDRAKTQFQESGAAPTAAPPYLLPAGSFNPADNPCSEPDVACKAFPKTGVRHNVAEGLAALLGMMGVCLGSIILILKGRDIR